VVKNGFKNNKQSYRCKNCGKQFYVCNRLNSNDLYRLYLHKKQTIEQLSEEFSVSISTIQRVLRKYHYNFCQNVENKKVIVLMDATYWGRNFGVIVFKDSRSKRILWRKFISKKETLFDYQEGIEYLENNNFVIEGIVCDGLRGMFKMLSKYRVQLCIFHQYKIVERYLTKRPELPASQELLSIVKLLAHTDKESFIGFFEQWKNQWELFLNERKRNRQGKSYFVHKRLRSACLSISRNMPYLWTWYDNLGIGIPNTNNGLEGQFTDLKSKLRNHNGLSKEHRKTFIDAYLSK